MNTFKVALLEGGSDRSKIASEAVKVLRKVEDTGRAKFDITTAPFGGGAYFSHEYAFPEEAKIVCDDAGCDNQRSNWSQQSRVG